METCSGVTYALAINLSSPALLIGIELVSGFFVLSDSFLISTFFVVPNCEAFVKLEFFKNKSKIITKVNYKATHNRLTLELGKLTQP